MGGYEVGKGGKNEAAGAGRSWKSEWEHATPAMVTIGCRIFYTGNLNVTRIIMSGEVCLTFWQCMDEE